MAASSSHLRVASQSRVGKWLREKYRLDRVLGIGGMATGYVATHRNKRRFAVKVLHTELSVRHDIRKRFVREGYIANTVAHPGAVAVLDDDVAEDGSAFLVMPGGDRKNRRRNPSAPHVQSCTSCADEDRIAQNHPQWIERDLSGRGNHLTRATPENYLLRASKALKPRRTYAAW